MAVTSMAEELSGHRFFQALPDDLVTRLAECARNVVFEPGATLCAEGSPATGFFAIRSGRVLVGIHVPHRGLEVLETRLGGDVIGFSWMLPPYRWQIDAVAADRVHAVELHADCLLPYFEEHPEDGYLLLRQSAERMQDLIRSTRLRLLDVYGTDDVVPR